MLELTFITSSRIKREHAKYLCRHYNLLIRDQRNYGKGYDEPRIREREELLSQSIEDALKRWRKNVSNPDDKLFFIEDTSVIVHALSKNGQEVPGVDIKYWMQENEFSSIDTLLKSNGNNRSVTVRSDVLLTLTAELEKIIGKKYIQFTSQTNGSIVDHEFEVGLNPIYPWLDDKTFNKWFVPDGCHIPISMLPIEEANHYDFRAAAFQDMLNFLEKFNKVNKKDEGESGVFMTQTGLHLGPFLFVVSGPTCAGKTILAEFMMSQFGYYHIEASDFMYLNYHQKLGVGSPINIAEFAQQALLEKPSIVVEKILEHLDFLEGIPVVITGLRAPEEIDYFMSHYKGDYGVEVITVDAPEKIRLDRYLDRKRGRSVSEVRFYKDCRIQREMGLGMLMSLYSNNLINNDGKIKDFFCEFERKYQSDLYNMTPLNMDITTCVLPATLEEFILAALYSNNSDYLTTAEIANLINKTFKGINKNKNNVSRYFNQRFHPYYEIKKVDKVNKYRLSQTGRTHALWIKRLEKRVLLT